MSEPATESSRVFTIGDFLKIKENRLEGLGHSTSPKVLVIRTSLKGQIDSIKDLVLYLANEKREKNASNGHNDIWDKTTLYSEREKLINEGLNVSLDEFVNSYSQTTAKLVAYYDSVFGDMSFDRMDEFQRGDAIAVQGCVNLRVGTEKEMAQFARMFNHDNRSQVVIKNSKED